MKKCCSDCKTTKTPLWRSGPSGPKVGSTSILFFKKKDLICFLKLILNFFGFVCFQSLCNACGIRYRKKRPSATATAAATAKNDMKKGKIGKKRIRDAWRLNIVPLELMEGQKRRQWGEVERAALLLMALSCGAVFA